MVLRKASPSMRPMETTASGNRQGTHLGLPIYSHYCGGQESTGLEHLFLSNLLLLFHPTPAAFYIQTAGGAKVGRTG